MPDTTPDASSFSSGVSATSASWSHTCAGSDRGLVVSMSLDGSGDTNPTCTAGGVAMTRIAHLFGQQVLAFFWLTNPPAGTFTIQLNWTSPFVWAGTAQSFNNVHQTTPHSGTADAFEAATGTSTSHTIASTVGGMVVDALSLNAGTALGTSADIGQTDTVSESGTAATLCGTSYKAGAASVTMTWSWSTTSTRNAHALISLNSTGGATGIEQEGFRWRNDDGTETTATWKAAENTNVSAAPDAVVRLRMLVNVLGGDPASKSFRLQYRKVGAASWRNVDRTG